MSLLRDIQNELAAPGMDVTNVLRKCKILAVRLGSAEFSQWVDWELNGYPESQPTPPYRHLPTSWYGNFLGAGWSQMMNQPLPEFLFPEKWRSKIHEIEFREGIAKASSLVSQGGRIEEPEMAAIISQSPSARMNCIQAWRVISGNDFEQMISAIKNRILDFVLEIEAENPDAGEAPPKTQPIAPEKVQSLVHNHFYAAVGNIAQGSHDFTQDATVGISSGDLSKFISEFTARLDELKLDEPTKQKAAAQLATLKAQEEDPDPVIVKQAGRTLRNLTEGTIASMLATAAQPHVWQWVHQILQSFK